MRPGQVHTAIARGLTPLGLMLSAGERAALALAPTPSTDPPPVVFVLGVPRSGTTLAFQCLTRRLDVSFPSHLTALFPAAPALALALSDAVFRRPHRSARSMHGYALGDGLRGPNEWETLFRRRVYGRLRGGRRELPDLDRLARGIGRWFDRPVVLKTLNAYAHIPTLMERLPSARCVWIDREPLAVARSIYRAKRRERRATSEVWYVTDETLARRAFTCEAEQIAAQITTIRTTLRTAFDALPENRRLRMDYADLCRDPEAEMARVAAWLGPWGRMRPGGDLPPLGMKTSRPLEDQETDAALCHLLAGPSAPEVTTARDSPRRQQAS